MKYSKHIVNLMRNQDGDFEVRITDDGRIIPVIDNQYLTVLNTIGRGSMTIQELCESTSIPQSTVYFILGKMEKEGLIKKIKNGRTSCYEPASHMFLYSADTETNPDTHEKIKKFWKEATDKDLAAAVISKQFFFNKTGIDFSILIRRFGRKAAFDLIEKNSLTTPEEVFSSFFDIYSLKSHSETISTEDTVVYELTVKSDYRDDNDLILNTFIGLVVGSHEKLCGKDLLCKGIEKEGDSTVTYTVFFEEFPKTITHVKDIIPSEEDDRQFIFVIPDGKTTTIVTNPAELQIIDMLSEGPVPMQTVILSLLFPKSTAIMYIKTLMDKGMIESFHAPSGAIYLRKTCTVILRRQGIMTDLGGYTDLIENRVSEGFVNNLVVYISTSLIELGFDGKKLAQFFGDYFGDIEYSYELPQSPLDALQMLLGYRNYAELSPKCTGICPFQITLTISNDKPGDFASAYILDGIISCIIKKYHGKKPIIRDVNEVSGNFTKHICTFCEEVPYPSDEEEKE